MSTHILNTSLDGDADGMGNAVSMLSCSLSVESFPLIQSKPPGAIQGQFLLLLSLIPWKQRPATPPGLSPFSGSGTEGEGSPWTSFSPSTPSCPSWNFCPRASHHSLIHLVSLLASSWVDIGFVAICQPVLVSCTLGTECPHFMLSSKKDNKIGLMIYFIDKNKAVV